ncbi:MAG: flagellar motor switch protein FliG [Alphaproteobacteria bacterium]|nr:flagellar motor switch protein FliG [Alphaproteobacteria bacterium]
MTKDYMQLTGAEKCAIVLMTIDESNLSKIFSLMDQEEIKEISSIMATLGTVQPDVVERLIIEFTNSVTATLSFVGNMQNTERLLNKVLVGDQVSAIMEEIRGPAGRNTWDKLGNINEEVLANYLKNEYPQTIALIMSKIQPAHAAKVLSALPETLTFDVIQRMLTMEPVQKEVLDGIEKTLRAEFISNLTKTTKNDNNAMIAEIFNNFDRFNESKYMSLLEQRLPDSAEKVKGLMFTFDDLLKISPSDIQTLLRFVDKNKLPMALKGAKEEVRVLFLNNMSQRASKILAEDMEGMGPIRIRDVDDAQSAIINVAKDLIAKSEITVRTKADSGDELIY